MPPLWTGDAGVLPGAAADGDAGDDVRGRLDTELGYGLPAFQGRFTATPHAGFALSGSTREYLLGWRLGLVRRGDEALDLKLEAKRREPHGKRGGESDHTIGFKVEAKW